MPNVEGVENFVGNWFCDALIAFDFFSNRSPVDLGRSGQVSNFFAYCDAKRLAIRQQEISAIIICNLLSFLHFF